MCESHKLNVYYLYEEKKKSFLLWHSVSLICSVNYEKE